ncbi:MAG: hypothetical protein HMLKMBBP_01979 [Planctomycetes bacterium]|nr:hypothetical protein [Planctomycetota bacterium]
MRRLLPSRTLTALAAVFAAAAPALAGDPPSEETIAWFKQNCTSCHTIGGGRLSGPDLKGVLARRTRAQLETFIADPKAAIDSGDPYWVKAWNDSNGVYMPAPAGASPDRIRKAIDLIEAESAKEKSQFAGTAVSDRPLVADDVARGRALFEGTLAFREGAPSCIGCHSVDGLSGFGGGRLGKDLTHVFARLGGRKPLAAWLSAPQSPVMTPVYRDRPFTEAEILGLVAYLKERSETNAGAAGADLSGEPRTGGSGMFAFLAAGVGGLLAALALFDHFWRSRFRSVRRSLVEGSKR